MIPRKSSFHQFLTEIIFPVGLERGLKLPLSDIDDWLAGALVDFTPSFYNMNGWNNSPKWFFCSKPKFGFSVFHILSFFLPFFSLGEPEKIDTKRDGKVFNIGFLVNRLFEADSWEQKNSIVDLCASLSVPYLLKWKSSLRRTKQWSRCISLRFDPFGILDRVWMSILPLVRSFLKNWFFLFVFFCHEICLYTFLIFD